MITNGILADMQRDPSSDQDRSWRTDAIGAYTDILNNWGWGMNDIKSFQKNKKLKKFLKIILKSKFYLHLGGGGGCTSFSRKYM